ncbi:MAG: DUF1697 domain-containing protein [Candidatus Thermoplasmatota archaeon]
MTTFIVLLRGVNVGGNNRVPMADLRQAVENAGFANARTYVNSGNLVMDGKGTPAGVEEAIEAIVAKHFKVDVPVVVRTADQWPAYVKGNPFPTAEAKFVQLGLSKSPPASASCANAIQERAAEGEQVKVVGDAVWIHFVQGVGKSKLTPAFLDKAAGSPLTMRNWNTVQELAKLST